MPFLQTLGGGSVSGFRILNNEFEPDVEATGGIEYVWFDTDGYKHKTHMFVDNGNLTFTKADGPIAFALVAGGGGGAVVMTKTGLVEVAVELVELFTLLHSQIIVLRDMVLL